MQKSIVETKIEYAQYKLATFTSLLFGTHLVRSGSTVHSHDFWEMTYLLSGSLNHVCNGNTEILTRGTLVLLRPSDLHSMNDLNEKYIIHRDILFSESLFLQICDFISPNFYANLIKHDGPIYFPVSEEIIENIESRLLRYGTIDESTEEGRDMIMSFARTLGAQILALYRDYEFNKSEKYSDWFNSVLVHLRDPKVLKEGIPEIIRRTGYSHGHLCRIFKKHTGKQLLSILTENRMVYAAALIRNSNYTLVDIASQVGYESLSHFITLFQKYHSISPYKYKIRSRKNFRCVSET